MTATARTGPVGGLVGGGGGGGRGETGRAGCDQHDVAVQRVVGSELVWVRLWGAGCGQYRRVVGVVPCRGVVALGDCRPTAMGYHTMPT